MMRQGHGEATPFRLGVDSLTPQVLRKLAEENKAPVVLEPGVLDQVVRGHRALLVALEAGEAVYGANTAFGGDATEVLEGRRVEGLQLHLARSLDAAVGDVLSPRVSRGAVIARSHVLARGGSAVSPEVLEALVRLCRSGVAPVFRASGSLGASGDLVTLAPLPRLLAGDPVPAWVGEDRVTGPEALAATEVDPSALAGSGLEPVFLSGRDSLALVNGLSGAAAVAALAWADAWSLLQWALQGIAATGWALGIRRGAWAADLNGPPLRLHPGQATAAASLRRVLEGSPAVATPTNGPIQDPYSLRCAPQLLGPVLEGLEVAGAWLQGELDGVSDNPVLMGDPPGFRNGGNFFGGYVAAAADLAAGALARLGDLLDRQGFLLVAGDRGLPRNLIVPGSADVQGLKGVHQTATAVAMELQRGAVPAAPFARSAEGHNQDVVSNAMAAALALSGQVERAATLVAAHTLMAARAVELRGGFGEKLGDWVRQVDAMAEDRSGTVGYSTALERLSRWCTTHP